MVRGIQIFILLLLFPLIAHPFPLNAGDTTKKPETEKGKTKVTLIEGKASLLKKDTTNTIQLHTGAFLSDGDQISTSDKSRVEIILPDKSIVRFDENTICVANEIAVDSKTNESKTTIDVVSGRVWANILKLSLKKNPFSIAIKMAMANTYGACFKISANTDNTTIFKVYSGEVSISSTRKEETGMNPATEPKQEWIYTVSEMQQVIVKADGGATKPFRFSAVSDRDEWTQWNQIRDGEIVKQMNSN